MKLTQVNTLEELKLNQIILFLDNENKVRGMDRIVSIKDNNSYEYINSEGKVYQGNWNKFIGYKWKAYLVDEKIFNYSDKDLDSAILRIEGVFEILFGEVVGNFLYKNTLERVINNFEARIKLIDFCQINAQNLYTIRFEDDEEITKDKNVIKFVKKNMKEELNYGLFDHIFNKLA